MYISTRGQEKLSASKAILKGLSSDGGLFIPEEFPKLNIDKSWLNLSYPEIAKRIFKVFLDDYTQEEIDYCVSKAYNKLNFEEEFAGFKSFDDMMFLELYKGPTLAFKDMALTILPFLIEVAKKKNGVNDKSLILVATSGDTGGAALSSFMRSGEFDTVVLYPNKGVSEIQEKQMLYYTDSRTKAFAVDGNFDDCQNFVKSVFKNYPKASGVLISSANSINIGRLIPQVVYYVYAYLMAVKTNQIAFGDKLNACVPTGNFGDIFAGYIAREIGVNYDKFICASNVNNVLTDFFNTGVYNRLREFKKSNSPAMDILVSSNLERLVYLACGRNDKRVSELMQELNEKGSYKLNESEREFLSEILAGYSTQTETLQAINKAFAKYGYLIDPHTAVAFDCYQKLAVKGKTLIVSTASPYKFPKTVASALNIDKDRSEFELIKDIASYTGTKIPLGISKLKNSNNKTIVKTKEQIKDIVEYKNLKVEISLPATSANLGCAFDTAGIAFSLYNTFKFESAEKDQVVGFKSNSNNLVLSAYRAVFEKYNKKYIPIKITMGRCKVPSSRGLGSSATCIVAGVLAANYMLKNIFSSNELLNVMTELEGHPDNVAPCYLGGLVTSFKDGDIVYSAKVNVSKKLNFYALVPNFELLTKSARKALPKAISYEDAVHNISRVAILKSAFENGELNKIKAVFDDRLHQPYRLELINGGKQLKEYLENLGFAVTISGAGPTLLAVIDKDVKPELEKFDGQEKWSVYKLKVQNKGAILND